MHPLACRLSAWHEGPHKQSLVVSFQGISFRFIPPTVVDSIPNLRLGKCFLVSWETRPPPLHSPRGPFGLEVSASAEALLRPCRRRCWPPWRCPTARERESAGPVVPWASQVQKKTPKWVWVKIKPGDRWLHLPGFHLGVPMFEPLPKQYVSFGGNHLLPGSLNGYQRPK